MVRTEISLFLKNVPGELGKLANMLADAKINIDAMTIQDASDYVRELFKARGKSLKRVASIASYNSVRQDSVDFALIRLVVDQTDLAINLLSQNDYLFDIMPVLTLLLENQPGALAQIASRFGEAGINIHYVYGSAASSDGKYLFVFNPEDIEQATSIMRDWAEF